MALFAVILGAVLLVFGAIALRLDLKDRQLIRGRRGSVDETAIRAARRAAENEVNRQNPLPPTMGSF
jgi:hypothetical protein